MIWADIRLHSPDANILILVMLVLLKFSAYLKESNIHASVIFNVDKSVRVLEFDASIELKHAELEDLPEVF